MLDSEVVNMQFRVGLVKDTYTNMYNNLCQAFLVKCKLVPMMHIYLIEFEIPHCPEYNLIGFSSMQTLALNHGCCSRSELANMSQNLLGMFHKRKELI